MNSNTEIKTDSQPLPSGCVHITSLFQSASVSGFVASILVIMFLYIFMFLLNSDHECGVLAQYQFPRILLCICCCCPLIAILDAVVCFAWKDETRLKTRKQLLIYPLVCTILIAVFVVVMFIDNKICLQTIGGKLVVLLLSVAVTTSLIFHFQCISVSE